MIWLTKLAQSKQTLDFFITAVFVLKSFVKIISDYEKKNYAWFTDNTPLPTQRQKERRDNNSVTAVPTLYLTCSLYQTDTFEHTEIIYRTKRHPRPPAPYSIFTTKSAPFIRSDTSLVVDARACVGCVANNGDAEERGGRTNAPSKQEVSRHSDCCGYFDVMKSRDRRRIAQVMLVRVLLFRSESLLPLQQPKVNASSSTAAVVAEKHSSSSSSRRDGQV